MCCEPSQEQTINSHKFSVHGISQKPCGRSHLHIGTFLTEHSDWLIKLSYIWSPHTTLIEEWTYSVCVVQ